MVFRGNKAVLSHKKAECSARVYSNSASSSPCDLDLSPGSICVWDEWKGVERDGSTSWFALYSNLECTGNTDLHQKSETAVQSNPPYSPCCKTQGGFLSLHHLLSVRVIWVRLPTVMQHLQLCGSPSKHIISLQPCAPLQSSAPVLAAELLWEEKTPPALPLGLREWALRGLLPANCWNGFLKLNNFSTSTAQEHTASPINSSSNQLSISLSAWQQWPLLHNRDFILVAACSSALHQHLRHSPLN